MPTRELGVKLSADATQFKRGMGSATALLGRFRGALGAASAGLVAFAGVKGLAGATQAFARFDQKMTESQAIMGDLTNTQMANMQQAAIDVSTVTDKSASEAAESFFFLASAGLDAEQSISALPQVAQFAQAGMFDMATATDLATDAQSALGLTSENTAENLENLTRVTDVFVRANQLANASVEQFSEAMTNKLGARLRRLNKDIEEGTAALAALADQGVKGRRAGRGLNIVLRDLSAQAVRSQGAFEDMGVEVFDTQGNMRNLADIVADFEAVLEGASDQQKAMAFETLGLNRRAQDYLGTLLGLSDELREYEDQLRSSGGATEEVANKQLQTLNKQVALLGSEVQAAKIEVGELIAPGVTQDVKALRIALGLAREEISKTGEAAEEAEQKSSGFFGRLQEIDMSTPLTQWALLRSVWEEGRDRLIEMNEEMERNQRIREGVTRGGLTGGGFGPPGMLPEDVDTGADQQGVSARQREIQRQQKVTAQVAADIQRARTQRLEEELGLFSRRIQAKREELRVAVEQEASERERVRLARELLQLRQQAAQATQPQAVGLGGEAVEGARARQVEVPSLPSDREKATEVEGPEQPDLDDDMNELAISLKDVQGVVQTLAPAIATLTNESRSAASKILTLASSIVQMLSKIGAVAPGPAGAVGAVFSTFAGLFQHGGQIPTGQVGIVGEGGMPEVVEGPARVTPMREVVREGGGGGGADAIAALLENLRPVSRYHVARDIDQQRLRSAEDMVARQTGRKPPRGR